MPMAPPPSPAPQLRVTASSLNVRAAPTLDAPVLRWLKTGAIVERIETSPGGYWHRVRAGDTEGWCAHKYLASVQEPLTSEFAWMLIAAAEQGVAEVPGSTSSARIAEYLRSTLLDEVLARTDETPWCSAFVNWCVERAGYEGTDSAWARSWLKWGRTLETPTPGCIAVFTRGASNGHVAFFVSESESHIQVLGGNQGNRVCIAEYARDRLLGYREPGL